MATNTVRRKLRVFICLAGISMFSIGVVKGVDSQPPNTNIVDTMKDSVSHEQSAFNIRSAEGAASLKERIGRIEDQHLDVKFAELKSSNDQIKTMLWCILGGGISILLKDFLTKGEK